MTTERIVFALVGVYCMQQTNLIEDSEKESRLFMILNFTGYDNKSIEEMLTLYREGDAESLLRNLGMPEEEMADAITSFEANLTKH